MTLPLQARVHGAGPTGALAALALADAGWAVRLVDPLDAERLQQRSRAYAFTHSSRRLLQRLGLWQALEPLLTPFRDLQLRDLALDPGGDFGVGFVAADLAPVDPVPAGGAAAVGWIAEHGPLLAVLLERLQAHPAVTLQLGQGSRPDDAAVGACDLLVAADGPASPLRTARGIGVWRRVYRQACLTAQVQLRGSAPDQAWELFRPEGPFALLPLGGQQVQVVWSAPVARCRQLEQLGGPAFLDALAGTLPDRFQPDALLDTPRAFPVERLLAHRLHSGSLVLVGESAHRCHPVGGQGLNLCWRDVAVLHRLALRVASGRLRPRRLPAAYARRRWPDLLATLLVTDLLVRLYSTRLPLLLPPRRLAVLLLQRFAPLRRLVLSQMTNGTCLPSRT
ncbi:FAD-dependent monooxygenase [Synechococcus sp. CBW1002]|jgi:2-octaprenyl-6-methoxyphenol hydroxylase|uniref:FAD-dependent monooxygenase n=1 Tax=Synechococcus sp. CBW1002 TaxID=1353134 RepID=UPI0018CDCA22|nr:FAD-dependent monooxygenase [Synechococcus sp. CBW1002]QPN59199.1 FAD-dependent monooxygenase [Synechococcus sp. CBW1002]